jgi:PIN domain nuclease of toxin-antitoxin system
LDRHGVRIVAIDERHALTSPEPEPTTRDPFGRMLLAQCQVDGLRLITNDRALAAGPLAAKAEAGVKTFRQARSSTVEDRGSTVQVRR